MDYVFTDAQGNEYTEWMINGYASSNQIISGNYTVTISYLGFDDKVENIILDQNIRKNFILKESNVQLNEVVVTENPYKINIKKPKLANATPIKRLKKGISFW